MAAALFLRHWIDDYRTVYNPIEYVLYESDAVIRAYKGFRYLVDVYDGATLLGRLKVPLDPNQYGRADVHGICESYLTSNVGTIGSTDAFTNNAESWKTFKFKFGEEYFNPATQVWETHAAMLYTRGVHEEQTEEDIIIFNASLPNYRGTTVNFYDWQTTDYYENYTVTGATRRWLTNAPTGAMPVDDNTTKVELTDEGWIYFLYDHASNPITKAGLTTYLDGVIVAQTAIGLTAGVTENHLRLASGPATINTYSAGLIPSSGVDAYSLNLANGGTQCSEIFYYSITSECRYETRRIEFLNSLGGFDFFNFTKVSRRSEKIERKFFKMNQDNLDSSDGSIDYSISDREKVQYYTISRPSMKLISDWVSVDIYNYLLEMLSSPEVYLHEADNVTGDMQRIPVKSLVGKWEEKRSKVDSVFNLEVTIDFGMDNIRQRW